MGRLKSSLLSLAALALVFVPAATAMAAGVPQIEVNRKYVYLKDVEAKVIEKTNIERVRAGKPELSVNEHLTRTAEYKSLYPMQYLKADGTVHKEHGFATGPAALISEAETDPAKLEQAGIDSRDMFGIVKGENMAYTSGFADKTADQLAEAIVNQWMLSAAHKDAILSESWVSIGVGVTMSDKGIMCIQHFSTENPSASDAVPNPMVTNQATAEGWFQRTDGAWSYSRNQQVVTGWFNLSGKYYYLDALGRMQTGWLKEDGKQYYLDNNGVMAKGWLEAGGKWYYMKNDGSMAYGAIDVGGKKYYMDDTNGQMQTGWFKDSNGSWRFFKSSGEMQTGWVLDDSKWYYMDDGGVMQTGWQKIGGKWYYLSSSGAMARRWARLSGIWYYLGEDGAMRVGWQQVGSRWYYLKASGEMAIGWQQLGGKWYYLDGNGAMVTGTQKIGNTTYRFNSDGSWQG